MAAKKLSAKIKKVPLYKTFLIKNNYRLPYPLMNIINGGAHANNGLRIQEFMIRPDKAKSFSEAMRVCFVVIKNLSKIIKDKGLSTSWGKIYKKTTTTKKPTNLVKVRDHIAGCFFVVVVFLYIFPH